MAKLNHIAVLVENLDEAVATFNKVWGIEPEHIVLLEDHGIRTAAYHFDNILVELMEPSGPDSGMAKTLEKRGACIHHMAIDTNAIDEKMDDLKKAGFKFTSEKPSLGYGGNMICFLHPKSTGGILTELVEMKRSSD
jgi:methylmalonyl-CoA/ethylmalonyl-CoA epimerase